MLKGDKPLLEVTLRKYERPNGTKKEVARKFLLSIGMLQPGDSRDIIVDVFLRLLEARKESKIVKMDELLDSLKDKPGASPSNLRRQLRRLKALKLVEKKPDGYRIAESGSIEPILDNYIIQFLVNPSLERIRNYVKEIDKL